MWVLAASLRIVTLGAGGFARGLIVIGAIPLAMHTPIVFTGSSSINLRQPSHAHAAATAPAAVFPIAQAHAVEHWCVPVAIAQPAAPAAQGRREIQMDGMARENSRAVVGESVRVAAVEAAPARTVLLAPLDPGSYGPAEIAGIRARLAGRAVLDRRQ